MSKKRRRRSPEQIIRAIQEGEVMLSGGRSLGEVYQKLEITESTWLRWKKLYGGRQSDEAKRLRELELEPTENGTAVFCIHPDIRGALCCLECEVWQDMDAYTLKPGKPPHLRCAQCGAMQELCRSFRNPFHDNSDGLRRSGRRKRVRYLRGVAGLRRRNRLRTNRIRR